MLIDIYLFIEIFIHCLSNDSGSSADWGSPNAGYPFHTLCTILSLIDQLHYSKNRRNRSLRNTCIYLQIYKANIDIFVNCNLVVTRWQYYSTHLHTNNE